MSRIKSIIRKQIGSQRLYNLAVKDDESYVANGIVVHNCKSYIRANLKTSRNQPSVEGLPTITKSERDSITLSQKINKGTLRC